MKLPIYQSKDTAVMDLQTNWASAINPVLSQPSNNSLLLQSVKVVSGDNSINHLLGKKLTGWSITRMRGSFVQIYDKQDSNQLSALTLVLNSSGTCTIDLEVF